MEVTTHDDVRFDVVLKSLPEHRGHCRKGLCAFPTDRIFSENSP